MSKKNPEDYSTNYFTVYTRNRNLDIDKYNKAKAITIKGSNARYNSEDEEVRIAFRLMRKERNARYYLAKKEAEKAMIT